MVRSFLTPSPDLGRTFGRYAAYYDILYLDKDYAHECDFIEAIFGNARIQVREVLDVGCGTGGHALTLARRGYRVTGVDRSPDMIKLAAAKTMAEIGSEGNALAARFLIGDMRDLSLPQQFDAAICMFASLGYVLSTLEVRKALRIMHRHLRPGAPFVCDVWNGLAVLTQRPSERLKVVEKDGVRVVRFVHPTLDASRHVCQNDYYLLVVEGSRVVEEVRERHDIRFFFPQELIAYLEDAGFEEVRLCPFPQGIGRVSEDVWNMAAVALAGEHR